MLSGKVTTRLGARNVSVSKTGAKTGASPAHEGAGREAQERRRSRPKMKGSGRERKGNLTRGREQKGAHEGAS